MASKPLVAPFPWFGGKRLIAKILWDRVGPVRNYVEPFCGSCAMLLSSPTPAPVETVNDADAFLANFWRAVKAAPLEVAAYADYPVSEIDLHARGDYLFYGPGRDEFKARMVADPEFYDAKRAGWWVWGQCAWIGTGWGPRNAGKGVNRKIPRLGEGGGVGINRHLPHLGNAGKGTNRKLPGNAKQTRLAYIQGEMTALSERLRDVHITCGDWRRVLTDCATVGQRGHRTLVFLDPPYDEAEHKVTYAGGGHVWKDVCEWALEAGKRENMVIALCGYAGTFTPPPDWDVLKWAANGGYGNQGLNRAQMNGHRETVWFSPGAGIGGLFGGENG